MLLYLITCLICCFYIQKQSLRSYITSTTIPSTMIPTWDPTRSLVYNICYLGPFPIYHPSTEMTMASWPSCLIICHIKSPFVSVTSGCLLCTCGSSVLLPVCSCVDRNKFKKKCKWRNFISLHKSLCRAIRVQNIDFWLVSQSEVLSSKKV
jgi:hypothetical protein